MSKQSSNFQFNVIGTMSGTSLDGLDIAYCVFTFNKKKWSFDILNATTISYDKKLEDRLAHGKNLSALELSQLNIELGNFIGNEVHNFIKTNNLAVDFIASHGHTIFHTPIQGLTVQIGSGACVASKNKLPVVCDFRTTDVASGGQGAPLVPIGDQLLFGNYDGCLNLGGFSNISYSFDNRRVAYDICPVNIVLNALCKKIGLPFDDQGKIASNGTINESLLQELNKLDHYTQSPPKSLGLEWVEKHILPLCESTYKVDDLISTITQHASEQIAKEINKLGLSSVLLTGGGTYNSFLVHSIQKMTNAELIIPHNTLVNFKEALIFAFLGVLRWLKTPNCLSSVTGAKSDVIGGAIYYY